MTQVPAQLLEAYRAAQFRVDAQPAPFYFRIGQVSQDLLHLYDQHGVDCAAYLTAWNPWGKPQPGPDNERAQAQLAAELARRGFFCLTGAGEDPWDQWTAEQSLLALGLGRDEAAELGRRFHQNAIVCCGPDGLPELVVLR